MPRFMFSAILASVLVGCAPYSGTEHPVSFVSRDGTALAGSLVLPHDGSAPFPGAVLLHGAENATRSMAYRMHANILLERGFAVLLFDKRGAGESGGNADQSTYAQLVEDGLAAVAFIRGRSEVDADRVGVVGASESGWLTPEIAERSGGVAFVINKVGSPLSVRETVAWEFFNDMMEDGVSEESARTQSQIQLRVWNYYVSPSDQEQEALTTILAEWTTREDSQLTDSLREPSAAYQADIGYDPGPYLARTSTPMLYVYGLKDINIPTVQSTGRLDQLAASGLPLSYRVFENEGHELGGVRGFPPMYRLADGYAEILGDFAVRQAGPN